MRSKQLQSCEHRPFLPFPTICSFGCWEFDSLDGEGGEDDEDVDDVDGSSDGHDDDSRDGSVYYWEKFKMELLLLSIGSRQIGPWTVGPADKECKCQRFRNTRNTTLMQSVPGIFSFWRHLPL